MVTVFCRRGVGLAHPAGAEGSRDEHPDASWFWGPESLSPPPLAVIGHAALLPSTERCGRCDGLDGVAEGTLGRRWGVRS